MVTATELVGIPVNDTGCHRLRAWLSCWALFILLGRFLLLVPDLLPRRSLAGNRMAFSCQQTNEEGRSKNGVLKLFVHLPPLDIRDTVKYKEVMKQYPFFLSR